MTSSITLNALQHPMWISLMWHKRWMTISVSNGFRIPPMSLERIKANGNLSHSRLLPCRMIKGRLQIGSIKSLERRVKRVVAPHVMQALMEVPFHGSITLPRLCAKIRRGSAMKLFYCFTSGMKNRGDTNSNRCFLLFFFGIGTNTHPFDTPTELGSEAL